MSICVKPSFEKELESHYQKDYRISLQESVAVAGGLKGRCDAQEQVWILQWPALLELTAKSERYAVVTGLLLFDKSQLFNPWRWNSERFGFALGVHFKFKLAQWTWEHLIKLRPQSDGWAVVDEQF